MTQPSQVLTHPDLPGITCKVTYVTPKLAADWLASNADNQRTRSPHTVDRYAADMAGGSWLFNGASILLDSEGKLRDGQHRLAAIVDSSEPQLMLVVEGVDPSVMLAVDTGRRRSFADILRIVKGITNHKTAAATTVKWWYWTHGSYGTRNTPYVADDTYASALPSPTQLDAVWSEVEAKYGVTIAHAATEGTRINRARPGITPATYGLMWLILSSLGQKDNREKFWHELIVQADSPAADYPINCLANTLARRVRGDDSALTHQQQLYYLIHTYNKWVKGETLTLLKMPPRMSPATLVQPLVLEPTLLDAA